MQAWKFSSKTIAAIVGVAVTLPTLATAQWIDLEDDTRNRMRLRPFVDTDTPARDTQEKDIAVGDLNRDGWDDMIVVRKRRFSEPGVRQDVLLMNRRGRLLDMTQRWAPGFIDDLTDARDVFIGDFDGDEWPDAVIANTFGQQPRFYRNLGNDAQGEWLGLVNETADRFPFIAVPGDVSTLQFCAVWAGDVTGNGSLDLYFSNYKEGTGTTDVLFINDGTGVFSNQTQARLGENANVMFGTSVEIADVDQDGDNDIVKNSATAPIAPFEVGTHILYNDGSGFFRGTPQKLPGITTYMFTMGDLNGDTRLDYYIVNDGQDQVVGARNLVPDGPSDYATKILDGSPRTAGFGGNVKMADLDGDGDLDLGLAPVDTDIANCGFPNVKLTLFENPGNGLLQDNWTGNEPFLTDAFDLAFLDIDRDGCMDMFLGTCDGWNVYMQNCS